MNQKIFFFNDHQMIKNNIKSGMGEITKSVQKINKIRFDIHKIRYENGNSQKSTI